MTLNPNTPIGTPFGSWTTTSLPRWIPCGVRRPTERKLVVDVVCKCGEKATRDLGVLARGGSQKCLACAIAKAKRAGWNSAKPSVRRKAVGA